MPDMYAVYPLKQPSTYPFDVSRLSTGSALTAVHFCQAATKVSMDLSPCSGRLAKVQPRHPHTSTCARPSVRGIPVAWTIEWQQQSNSKAKISNNTHSLWERACPRWQHYVPPDRTRCLHRRQARLPQRKYVGRQSCIQTGRPVAASTAFDLHAPSGGRTARHLKETQPTESTAFASPASEFRGCC